MVYRKLLLCKWLVIPVRINIGICLFLSFANSYLLRTSFPVLLTEMLRNQNSSETDYTSKEEANVVGAFFIGYFATGIVGGYLSKRLGATAMVIFASLGSGLANLLIPFAFDLGIHVLFTVRVICGLLEGPLFPATQDLIAHWAPISEKSYFMYIFSGSSFGSACVILIGPIVRHLSWQYGYYITSAMTIVMALVMCYQVRDRPRSHKRISEEEMDYIESSTNLSEQRSLPLKAILMCRPFWALQILNFGYSFGTSIVGNAIPKYFVDIQKLQMDTTVNMLAGFYLLRVIIGPIFSWASERTVSKGILGVTGTRKAFVIASHIIPASVLFLFMMPDINFVLSAIVMALYCGFQSAANVTNFQNVHDLAPNFVGSLFAFISAPASATGVLSQFVLGEVLAVAGDTHFAWGIVFLITAILSLLSVVVFWCYGSGEVQPWNDDESSNNLNKVNAIA